MGLTGIKVYDLYINIPSHLRLINLNIYTCDHFNLLAHEAICSNELFKKKLN